MWNHTIIINLSTLKFFYREVFLEIYFNVTLNRGNIGPCVKMNIITHHQHNVSQCYVNEKGWRERIRTVSI